MTFRWTPNRPTNVTAVAVPGTNVAGKTDLFCGGHTWLPNGDLLSVGGTIIPLTPAFGHTRVFRFTTTTPTPSWTALGALPELNRHRWYGTPIITRDDRVLVAGHEGNPPPLPGEAETSATREYINANSLAGPWDLRDNKNYTVTAQCLATTLSDLSEYPRLLQLRTGSVMSAGSGNRSKFLDLNQTLCPTEERWQLGASMSSDRHDACFSHLIVHDEASPGNFNEFVYAIGGAKHYDAAALACCGCSQGSPTTDELVNTVEKMTNPTATQPWQLLANTLLEDRADANVVILLDGSLFLVGGEGWEPGFPLPGTCVARMTPELYLPPELFSGTDAGQWMPMAPHKREHKYHSTALMLPDGRVVLAGGKPLPGGSTIPGAHVVEVYSPPYMFHTARPEIVSAPPSFTPNGSTQTIIVSLRNSTATVKRVALLRPGAVTHSFDFNQRYISLRITSNTMSGTQATIQFAAPLNKDYAPKGWYLLTVLDDSDVPSEAVWVKLS